MMNLVTQESGPQKGTDSQTGILKGHPERFCVVMCACEAHKKAPLLRGSFFLCLPDVSLIPVALAQR